MHMHMHTYKHTKCYGISHKEMTSLNGLKVELWYGGIVWGFCNISNTESVIEKKNKIITK